ncbi:MAG: DUF2059 domain-containing protein [Hyphomicrobiaceae bacterium]|nr:DUF2059 domain-containing protein [Hyphomicrobiaceae bacterium]
MQKSTRTRLFLTAMLMALAASSAGTFHAAISVAQPAAAPADEQSDPDAARLEAAKALVAAIGGGEQARATVENLKKALIANIQASVPAQAVGFAAYAEAEMKPDSPRVVKYLADVESLAVNFYARRFTAEEMQAIAAFQTSPAGRKFQALTPELGSQIAARTMLFQGDVIRTIEKGAAAQQK